MFASAAANASGHWTDRYDWPGGDGYAGWLFGSHRSADGTYSSTTGLPGQLGLWVWPMGDGQYGAFGVVPRMKNPPLPNNDKSYYGVPGVWTANFRCPYPDDYFRDNPEGNYALTVGSRCRPLASVQVFRWAHVLIPKDTNDRIGASLEPEHYANPNNHVDGWGTELDYCKVRAGTWGSCMFGDIGVKTYTYPQTTVTPDIFYFKTT